MIPKITHYMYSLALVMCLLAPMAYAQVGGGFEDVKTYQDHLKDRNYELALTVLEKKDAESLTIPQKKLIIYLQTFKDVSDYKPKFSPLVSLEEDLDPSDVKKVKRYYRAAQWRIVDGDMDIAKDILVYNMFLWPGHPQSERLMTLVFDQKPGTYKPFDVAKKYFNRSSNYFYGGNYLFAVKDLSVLAVLENRNPMVFEQLGSSYYMMNEKQKAVDAWTTARFLNPKNKKLDTIIARTKRSIEEDAKKDPLKASSKLAEVIIDDPQMMGVFKRQAKAFEMAQKLRSQGLVKVKIEETDKGRYKVLVSREELIANKGNNK
ncbi:hypothetical protein HOH87_06135 [bacterium]|jgi:tetratricopeptide (TPR) repeat protein|nr:hypothetical protein [bacterium]